MGTWMDGAFFGIHYDLHANAADTELGRELTPEHLRRALARVACDWVQCDCKGHPGYTSWPTRTGSTAPGVVRDGLRVHRDVTRELGIRLGVHYSGVWDTRAIELHPEWAVVRADGSRSPDQTCRLSDYAERLLIPQLLEIIDTYDVDGFWVDGENWAATPCWCDRCRAEFTRRTGAGAAPPTAGEEGWARWLAFHRRVFVEYVERYTKAVHARKAGCAVCSNWLYTARQPEAVRAPVDYLSGDFDWAFGADRAAFEGRVMDGRGLPWNLMAWGFLKTGAMQEPPPWAMKTVTHLCQEVSEVLALGGAVMVYDTPRRSGRLPAWRQEVIAEVSRFCHERKDACFRTRTVPEAAVLHLSESYYAANQPLYNYGPALQPVEGALHVLLESHWSTDVLTDEALPDRLGQYRLVVLPEQALVDGATGERLRQYVAAGGRLVLSGHHLAGLWGDWLGVEAAGPPAEGTELEVAGEAVPVSGPWQPVRLAGAEAFAYHLTDGDPEQPCGGPAITVRRHGRGLVAAVHGPVFRDYYLAHYPRLRRLLGRLLTGLGVEPMVAVQAPPRLELVLRRQEERLVINLINRGAAEMLGPRRVTVEEIAPVRDVRLSLALAAAPAAVRVVPDDAPMEWRYEGGRLAIHLGEVAIHAAVVIE